ncbi:MAG: hypothetical protein GF329_17785 [Candidatus Lokiarchaeota archaeon]|nr:hypothetical protein [Candidatus Lokiarchaeota archaeon]
MNMSEIEDVERVVDTGYGIIRMLKEYGISRIFGIPDGHTLPLYDAILEIDGIDHTLVNDERTAIFAADAYSRVTGMLSVCDSGPAGAMNLPVGISEAAGFASPILALIGTVKVKHLLRNVPHDIPIADTLKPITKWSENVIDVENVPRFLNYAIRQAINGRPGPVSVIFPEDVLKAEKLKLENFLPMSGGSCSINSCRPIPPDGEIDYAVEMIANSEQPVIYSGSGAIRSGAYIEIKELSESLKAPVFSTISGKGIMVSNDKNLYFGTVGLFGEAPNHSFLRKKTDLVIVIGNRLTEDDTAYFKFPPQYLPMIQIDIEPAEIGLNYRAWGVVGDPKAALNEILNHPKIKNPINSQKYSKLFEKRQSNIEWLRGAHKKYREKDEKKWMNADPIKPPRVIKAISEAMKKEDYLVTDASSSSRWIGPYFPVKSIGRNIITPRGVGPTGFGLGALLGTCLALKDLKENHSQVILLTGDGGLMNGGISDLETIAKLKLDCCIVILNNSALGFVKYGQAFLYHRRYYQTSRPATDFKKVVESFGGNGFNVEKLAELDTVIHETIKSSGLNLVNVLIDEKALLPKNYY